MSVIQPTKVVINRVSIDGLNFLEVRGSEAYTYFHVKEIRVFEDVCKAFFTGQLVIETMLNSYESFLYPTAEVILDWECPRTDGGPTQRYQERMRVYSYDSKEINPGADGRVEHTIALIGQEYYNNQHNSIIRNFKNISGVQAATQLHNEFIQSNGGLDSTDSLGPIGMEYHPYQIVNKKPLTAIHNILDKCVYAQYQSCAPMYFRRKQGYVMKPLEEILKTAGVTENFLHKPGQGQDLFDTFNGYNLVIAMKPMSPEGPTSSSIRGAEVNVLKVRTSFLDQKTGDLYETQAQGGLRNEIERSDTDISKKISQTISEAEKGTHYKIFGVIDDLHQPRNIAKDANAGWNAAEESLITSLTYAQKYWMAVPGQTGNRVTCGDRIRVAFPVNTLKSGQIDIVNRTLFVPRLIHEIITTVGDDRTVIEANARTDIYAVWFGD